MTDKEAAQAATAGEKTFAETIAWNKKRREAKRKICQLCFNPGCVGCKMGRRI